MKLNWGIPNIEYFHVFLSLALNQIVIAIQDRIQGGGGGQAQGNRGVKLAKPQLTTDLCTYWHDLRDTSSTTLSFRYRVVEFTMSQIAILHNCIFECILMYVVSLTFNPQSSTLRILGLQRSMK